MPTPAQQTGVKRSECGGASLRMWKANLAPEVSLLAILMTHVLSEASLDACGGKEREDGDCEPQ